MDKIVFKERTSDNFPTNKKNVEVGDLLNNIPAKILFVIIAGFLFYNVFHSVKITVQKLDILKKARIEVESLRLDNLQLAQSLENMQSLEYVEVQARDRLNFGGKNEYIFVIPDDALEEARLSVESLLDGNNASEEIPGYEVWFGFVSHGI